MNVKKIASDNAMFFLSVVGVCLGLEYFREAVLDSSVEIAQFSTDLVGAPGYIRIDSSSTKKENENFWHDFMGKIKNGFLTRLTYEFSGSTNFEGDLAEKLVIKKDGYEFSFHIKEYERDSEHGFKIIKPEDLSNIPDNEKLGRVVYLTITPGE